MPDETNTQLLLARLSADSLARKLVEPFATHTIDAAVKIAQGVLSTVKETHLKESGDGPA